MIDLLKLLSEVLEAHKIRLECYASPYEMTDFDNGLRKMLIPNYDYNTVAVELNKAQRGVVYYIEDNFLTNYVVFRADTESELYIAGPFIYSVPENEDIERFSNGNSILFSLLHRYYASIPCIQDKAVIDGIMRAFLNCLFNGVLEVQYEHTDINLNASFQAQYFPPASMIISVKEIEERYEKDNLLSEAIAQGDEQTALSLSDQFAAYRYENRPNTDLRYTKSFLNTFNTLARKAVLNAQVHPAHIHNVSGNFAIQIVNTESAQELDALRQKMVCEYCTLSRRYSLKGYSAMVRKVINYIDFHYMKHISLKDIAAKLNYRPEYVSSQFTKEKGISFVEYLNSKRLAHAESLLTKTTLSITEIAESSGFADINYLSRLFKKHFGVTPSEYRRGINKRAADG